MEDLLSESEGSEGETPMEPETVTEDERFSRQADIAGNAAGAWARFAAQGKKSPVLDDEKGAMMVM